ncbi:MAG: ATP-binding protein, partial [Pseudomonadales bacterium]
MRRWFSIRSKVMVAMLAVVVVSVIFNYVLLNFALESFAKESSQERLLGSKTTLERFLLERDRVLGLEAQTLASSAALRATLSIPEVDDETVAYAIESILLREQEQTLMLLTRNDGSLWYAPDAISLFRRDLERQIQKIPTENLASSVHFLDIGNIYIAARVSITNRDQVLGDLIVARIQDDRNALEEFELVSDDIVTLLRGGDLLNSSSDDFMRAISTLSQGDRLGILRSSMNSVVSVDLNNTPYLLTTMVLTDQEGYMLLAKPFSRLPTSVNQAQQLALVFALMLLGLGVVASFFVARIISKPLASLTRATERFSADKPFELLERESEDEIGDLSSSFNAMAQTIQANQSRLSEGILMAEQASASKSSFLASMSHELRTPLQGVIGLSDILVGADELDEQYRELASIIHQSGETLLEVVNDILDFSKLDAGMYEVNPKPVNLIQLLDDIIRPNATTAFMKGLNFDCEILGFTHHEFVIGEAQIKRILMNLISNAVKYTESGMVLFRARGTQFGQSYQVSFEVIDTGIGIAEESLSTLFDPFKQAHGGDNRRFSGTGLGLALASKLAELLDARISVKSQLGLGSTFSMSFRLPIAEGAKDMSRFKPLEGHRLLIIGTESLSAGRLSQLVTDLGGRSILAANFQ